MTGGPGAPASPGRGDPSAARDGGLGPGLRGSDPDGPLVIRPPFPWQRLILGLGFLCAGVLLLGDRPDSGEWWWIPVLTGVVFTLCGGFLAFVERVVSVFPATSMARVSWRLAGLAVTRRDVDLTGADRIVLGRQKEVVIPEPGLVFVADTSYPVTVNRGREALLYVTGRSGQRQVWGVPVQVSLPSPAFFASFSQYAAALVATRLHLPLEHHPQERTLQPEDIPTDWLDPDTVRTVLTWRRY